MWIGAYTTPQTQNTPVVTTTSVPTGTVNTSYSVQLAAIGTNGAGVWSLAAGSLPAGLSINSAGFISGTPTAAGTSSYTVQIVDQLFRKAQQALSQTINSATPAAFDFYISPTAPDTNNVVPGGTLQAPWSINALNNATCRTAYSGKKVGLLDGVYGVNAQCLAAGGPATIVFNCEGGTVANPTVISSVNARKALIDAHNIPGQFGTGWAATKGVTIIGHTMSQGPPFLSHPGNIQFLGLVVTGAGCDASQQGATGIGCIGQAHATQFGGTPGFVVQDCEVYDFQSGSTHNTPCIFIDNSQAGLIHNNRCHDAITADTPPIPWHGIVSEGGCNANVYEFNTCYNVRQGCYEKNVPQGNSTTRYNYFEGFNVLEDFTNGDPGTTCNIYNNILVVVTDGGFAWNGTAIGSYGTAGEPSSFNFYNNTIYCTAPGIGSTPGVRGIRIYPIGTGNTPPAALSVYNNIFMTPLSVNGGGSAWGWIQCTSPTASDTGTIGPFNYNIYGSNNITSPLWGTIPAGSGQITPITRYTSSNWQSSVTGPFTSGTPPDVNSSFVLTSPATPPLYFVNPGQSVNPNGYKLASGSQAINFGHVGGVSSGAACDAGAWGGATPPTRIGCDFTSLQSAAVNGTWWAANSPWNAQIPSGAFASPMSNSASVITAYKAASTTNAFVPQSTTFTAALIIAPSGTVTTSWTFTYQSVSHTFNAIPVTGSVQLQLVQVAAWFQQQLDSDRSINIYSSDTGLMYDIYPDSTSHCASFNGTAAGGNLTVNSGLIGTIAIGQTLLGIGVPTGTTITGGSGTSWTLSASFSAGPTAMASTDVIPLGITTASVRPLSGGGWWNQANFLPAALSSGTASGACQVGGSVKESEWNAGVINHALHGAWPQGPAPWNLSGGNTNSPDSGQAYIYPARASDSAFGTTTTMLPEGARLQLDPSLTDAQLTALGVPTAMLPVCHAMQTYGWYCIDIDSTFPAQIKFLSTNPFADSNFNGPYTGAAVLPIALMDHVNWIHGPYIVGPGTVGEGVTVANTAGTCNYTVNYGAADGLVHVGDIVTVYATANWRNGVGPGGLQGFSPGVDTSLTSYWAGVSYTVLSVTAGSPNTFTLGTTAGAAITSTTGAMNVYFTTNAPLMDLATAISNRWMSS